MFQTKANSYAFLSLLEIAERGKGGVQAAEISSKYDLPTAYAAKVMSPLAKARIFQSDRGPQGGFRLARAPKDITALEIFEAMNGPLATGDILPDGASRNQQRGVSRLFDQVVADMRKRLKDVTLADLVASKTRKQ
jgi:Rrf2 family protein